MPPRRDAPRAWIGRLLGALLACLAGCTPGDSGPTVEKFVETREVMGTWATLTLITGNGKQAVDASEAAFAFLDSINALMNPRWETSEVSAVNARAATSPVGVGRHAFAVLERSVEMGARTGGAFDITVGPLIAFWKLQAELDELPDEDTLAPVRAAVGFERIRLDPTQRTVAFEIPGMRIDLGGIAKGYAIDGAVAAIQRAGVSSGIVEVGGDLRSFGSIPAELIGRQAQLPVRTLRRRAPPAGEAAGRPATDEAVFRGLRRTDKVPLTDPRPWPIGVQDPFSEGLLGRIEVGPRAVATSGHYRRFVTIAGRRFSHIIDPRSGWPVGDPASVTVIAATALEADGLATALTVLGAGEGLPLVESLPDVEALIITGSAERPVVHRSSGFPPLLPVGGSE